MNYTASALRTLVLTAVLIAACVPHARAASDFELRMSSVEHWIRGDGTSVLDLAVYVPTSGGAVQFSFNGKLKVAVHDGRLHVHLPLHERGGVRVPAYVLGANAERLKTDSTQHREAQKDAHAARVPCIWSLSAERTAVCDVNAIVLLDRLLASASSRCVRTAFEGACTPPADNAESIETIKSLFVGILREAVRKNSVQFVDAKGEVLTAVPDLVIHTGRDRAGVSFVLMPRIAVSAFDDSGHMLVVWATVRDLLDKLLERSSERPGPFRP